jgi:hypothetical protein
MSTTASSDGSVYAPPREINDVSECVFYHAMEIPGHGFVHGEWDLRGGVEEYLGNVDLRDKRVLEMGTASGFLCFEMEKRGAEVIGLDLCEKHVMDYVPYGRLHDLDGHVAETQKFFRKMNNGWWFAHKKFGSKAKVVYRSAYQVPAEIGPVDVATFGMILLHLHNPILALANALRLTRETAVVVSPVSEMPWEANVLGSYTASWASANAGKRGVDHRRDDASFVSLQEPPDGPVGVRVRQAVKKLVGPQLVRRLLKRPAPRPSLSQVPCMVFVPRAEDCNRPCTWWFMPPLTVQHVLAVLGFEDSKVSYHRQKFNGQPLPVYTVVAHRTQPMPERFDLGCSVA